MTIPKKDGEYDEIIPDDEEINTSSLSSVLKEDRTEKPKSKPKPKKITLQEKDINVINEKLDAIIAIGESLKYNCTMDNISKIQTIVREIKDLIK